MTKLGCEVVNSYWSSADMNYTPTFMSLLVTDLEARSAGSSGRALLAKLEHYCLDLSGASNALEWALRLQGRRPDVRRALEELLEWTTVEPEFQLLALVALGRDLERVARRLGRGQPSEDMVSEVFAHAAQALQWTHELVEGERADFVVLHSLRSTDAQMHRMARRNVAAESLTDDIDVADAGHVEALLLGDQLSRAVIARVIDAEERHLLEATRGRGLTLREFAARSGETYDALRMRRARAERRLRRHFEEREMSR
jgi:DNA-directed RNA polymerase specialized sigma24 family protein